MGDPISKDRIKIDYVLLITTVVLVILGILTIYSVGSSSSEVRAMEKQYIKQIYWAVAGFIIFGLLLLVNYQKLGEHAFLIYIGSVLLLILTLLIGKRIRGSRSWITLGGGFGFQPSEFVKLGIILSFAKFLEKNNEKIKDIKTVILALLIVFIPVALILLQPDFGTALVYIPVAFVMLYFAGIRTSHLLSFLIILAIAVVLPLFTTYFQLIHSSKTMFIETLSETTVIVKISLIFGVLFLILFGLYKFVKSDIIYRAMIIFLIFFVGLLLSALLNDFLKPYQKQRLIVFINPKIDPFGSGYNIIQSKIAIGAGGLFGKGLKGGTQSQLGFLPERSTDFIFSIFAEEWGFTGSFFLLVMYALFIYRGIAIIYNAKDIYGTLVASGIVGMFLFHIIINMGMTVGIMPITGIPLPFMSYGGSFLITSLASTSILFNIEMRRYQR